MSDHEILLAVELFTTYPKYTSLSEKDIERCEEQLEYGVDARDRIYASFPALGNVLTTVLSALKRNPDRLCMAQIAGVLFEREDDQPMAFLRNTALTQEERDCARVAKIRLAAMREYLAKQEKERGGIWGCNVQ